ncbi:hypothetical protein K470DRAFT_260822 [Piedraia hortae CBS 480.64]|uniref:Fanconi-associated nuclease n=1 Tax=Piedraia hortae CBS 480.64 TaxID=1314780 RepID=A0A6A7BRA5_9PEZI|nr:hypothetical protein K470DRAFT_260822 [Piedraia hortae CBS 480.64]
MVKDDDSSNPPPAKRVRRDVVSPSDDEAQDLNALPAERAPGIESVLPPVQTTQEAIEEYEAGRNAQLGAKGRLERREWVRGKSSIYVDAFILALETVLTNEGHLFDAAEHEVFAQWQQLSYDAQYLYVRLFLRKTSSWHRIRKLAYQSDITDLAKAAKELQLVKQLPQSASQGMENSFGTQFSFADRSEDCINDLEEASSLLLFDELKALARNTKVQGRTKKELLKAFRQESNSQTGLDFNSRHDSPGNRDVLWIGKILDETGPCIRLSLNILQLFERVHLVFYRATEWTEKSLTTIILARTSRRNFPDYIVSRSVNIFATRSLVQEYEEALRTQNRVDNILESSGPLNKEKLQIVLEHFERIYPRWRILLEEEQQKEDSIYLTGEGPYLRRLSPAWVYARLVYKGVYVLGRFKDYKREHQLLTELLEQRLFHTSKRGDWYQRKALIEEHYMYLHLPSPTSCQDEETIKKHWRRIALQTCEAGLEDQLTHLIYHHDLQKRILKLEKALKIPKRQQHTFDHVRLTRPAERTFSGIRIDRPSNRTVWVDPNDPKGECTVEDLCLAHYSCEMGFKGYHSEGGILQTLFAYLFYDILFAYMPNVFQTSYQTCPLDLHTDAFYPSRLSEINTRLNEISNGRAAAIVQGIWNAHSEKRTCIIGLNWDFPLNDILEIATAFPPQALSSVLRILAQEYGPRGRGVPDLLLWKENVILFAEVKSENDRLSDAQRVWLHVLSEAGVDVELCNVVATEVRSTKTGMEKYLEP